MRYCPILILIDYILIHYKIAMIRRWLTLTYYLYALRLAALSHFYFNPL